jgi:hypothetical protein
MTAMRGEKIYEADLDIVGITDYGVGLQTLLAGEEKIPFAGGAF